MKLINGSQKSSSFKHVHVGMLVILILFIRVVSIIMTTATLEIVDLSVARLFTRLSLQVQQDTMLVSCNLQFVVVQTVLLLIILHDLLDY